MSEVRDGKTAAERKAAARITSNGATNGKHDATQRAEDIVDSLGERFGHFLTTFSQQVNRLAARAREEAEDIVAEAQHLRRHSKKK